MSATARVLAVMLCGALVVRAARADTPEPPPEAGEGDYTLESADSLADDELELAVSAASDGRSGVRRSQRVTFRGGGTRGTLRDGDDALAGGRVEAPLAGGSLAAGRLAPRWGRGLVLGGAAEPWARTADDRGEQARFRGRTGDGLAYRASHLSLVAGRFARRRLVGARIGAGTWSLGGLTVGGEAQGSLALEPREGALELALGSHGCWRAEGVLLGEAGGTRLSLRVRGGRTAFRPLAEPARAGPPRALAASAVHEFDFRRMREGASERQGSGAARSHDRTRSRRTRGAEPLRASAFGSLWQWGGGRTGARAALEVAAPMGDHAAFACGIEEQHGARREPTPHTRAAGTRQGLWCEWRGGAPGARLTLRHELWGARAFAREAVRRAVVARAEIAAGHGSRVEVTHAVWLVRRGEQLYLPEPEADRLVLRSLSGAGQRTRAEFALPFATGDIRLGVALTTGGTRAVPVAPAWTVQWSRRSRLSGARSAVGSGEAHEIRGTDGASDERGVVRHAGPRQGTRGPGS